MLDAELAGQPISSADDRIANGCADRGGTDGVAERSDDVVQCGLSIGIQYRDNSFGAIWYTSIGVRRLVVVLVVGKMVVVD